MAKDAAVVKPTKKKAKLTPEELIVSHLDDNGIKMSWLAGKLELTPSHLYQVLKGQGSQKRVLSEDNRKKINEILKTNY